MVERGVFADYYTLTTLFMGRALGLFETLTQRSLVTYNTLMDGFCKIGEMEKAKELWCDMVSRGILPSYKNPVCFRRLEIQPVHVSKHGLQEPGGGLHHLS
ncbi:hypothetical protein JHK87_005466 [Glycine soja]|nr:hypothetical protein JHK87_005466 [Glycine soja]